MEVIKRARVFSHRKIWKGIQITITWGKDGKESDSDASELYKEKGSTFPIVFQSENWCPLLILESPSTPLPKPERIKHFKISKLAKVILQGVLTLDRRDGAFCKRGKA